MLAPFLLLNAENFRSYSTDDLITDHFTVLLSIHFFLILLRGWQQTIQSLPS